MSTTTDKQTVLTYIRPCAKLFGFDPVLILAMVEQESTYDSTQVRLEQGFYRGYTRPLTFATTTEVLLAASYGLMQTMGLSLYLLDYFEPPTNLHVCHMVDQYMVKPEDQILYGCMWLKVKQMCVRGRSEPEAIRQVLLILKNMSRLEGDAVAAAQGKEMRSTLKRYNGDDIYPVEVLEKYDRLITEVQV